ncbi:hypothetical protein ACROYT_G021210 [Oculina patagonica]
MFRVFTAAFCLSFLSIAVVDCSIDLKESVAELTAQFNHLLHLAKGCFSRDAFSMNRHYLQDRNVTCNDGTSAGYYLRKARGSKRWIVYLEGGEFCDSAASCDERYKNMKELMSSRHWSKTKEGNGILSTDPSENPSWWNANHVYIPYCSSDAWSGNASRWETGERFSFLGTRILEKVIKELMFKGLYHAKHLLLAGSSAGGIGVILNLDRLARRLHMAGLKVQVRGLADSGWYLDIPACHGGKMNCQPAQETNMIKQGMAYWRGVVPDDCARRNPAEKWRCYFAENVYRTDSKSPQHSPLFVFQWLYDQAQIAWAVSQMPEKQNDNNYISSIAFSLGEQLKQSFNRTKGLACAVFAPSCYSHTILTRDDWLKVMVGGKNLNDALDDWYQSSSDGSANCRTLIENECHHPQCDKTCPPTDLPSRKAPRSHGVPIKPSSDRAFPSRST